MQTVPTEPSRATASILDTADGPDPRPFDVDYIENPDQDTLRALTLEHTPSLLQTKVGSLNKVTRNKARMAKYTYILSTDGSAWSQNVIDPDKGRALIARQRDYIKAASSLAAGSTSLRGNERICCIAAMLAPSGV